MTIARSRQIDLAATPYYHCINRCVRRAFLCGEDSLTGKSYEHRRGWIADKIRELSGVFAIDVAAYAVMSNHYHIVLRVDRDEALGWDTGKVIERWGELFSYPVMISRFLQGECRTKAELKIVDDIVAEWRSRLHDISWFMRILNEYVARESNREDGVKGRFWEGRFKCQALLDEEAVLSCMAYVDLNPIRADMARTPETSDYTSIQERLREVAKPEAGSETSKSSDSSPAQLLPFADTATGDNEKAKAIPMERNAYFELVDWSGRALLDNKRGSIPDTIPPILTRLNIDPQDWLKHMRQFERQFPTAAGCIDALRDFARQTSRQWVRGLGNALAPPATCAEQHH